MKKFGLETLDPEIKMDGIILAVDHDHFRELGVSYLKSIMNEKAVLIDINGVFIEENLEGVYYMSLR